MRQLLIDYFGGLNLGGLTLSQELPFNSSNTPLYVKNAKKIYVDRTQYVTEPIVLTLDGLNVSNEIASVRVYFSADAKQLPPSYEDVLVDLRAGKDAIDVQGYQRRECLVNTSYQEDLMITELEYRFTKLI